MSSDTVTHNIFLHGRPGVILGKTALPIIFVMGASGLLTVVDAIFLGVYVGPAALGAVTLMFPVYMVIAALSTLVASGMSSLLARRIGAGQIVEARAVFARAHVLALVISAGLILLFLAFGRGLTLLAANGSEVLAAMGHVYLGISVMSSAFLFLLSINADALRSEGRAGLMAGMSLFVSLANIGLNYLLIARLGLGVAGSAWGTALAQALALGLLVLFRLRGRTELWPALPGGRSLVSGWRPILALGAPQSLSFLGLALVSATAVSALQMVAGKGYADTVSAYGIITRVMTFVFLPLLGLSQALQSIVGNNYGAGAFRRSDDSLRIGIAAALVYCLAAEVLLIALARPIGLLFVEDGAAAQEVARIMPVVAALYVVSGPVLVIAAYFQAIGDAARAAILSLSKPYLFTLPLIVLLAATFGERGIWFATPVADILLFGVTMQVLARSARQQGYGWGLFTASKEMAQ